MKTIRQKGKKFMATLRQTKKNLVHRNTKKKKEKSGWKKKEKQ